MPRMIKDRESWMNGLNASQVSYYQKMAQEHPARVVCRGGFRHRFHLNEIDPTAEPGLEIIPLADGTCEVRDWCMRGCGRYQTYLTDEDSQILWDTRDYYGDRDYIATGMDLTRADDRRFLQHVQQQKLEKEIARRMKIAQRARLRDVSEAG